MTRPDTPDQDELRALDAYWRASLYLCAGMIYLQDNPLLRRPLEPGHVKRRLLGHWGTDPGQCFVWVHLNRVIRREGLNMLYVSGPGHGAPAVLAHSWLEGVYSEVYPDKGLDEEGLRRFFKAFSFPGGVGSHCTPETPGSMHEGGELGYSLSHAFGAALDNPGLIVAAVVGDGEAETGPLAASWNSCAFLNPARDGAVLPIVHVNGYKISNPTLLGRMSRERTDRYFRGLGYAPLFVEGDDPMAMHALMARTMDQAVEAVRTIQAGARSGGAVSMPEWPVIILRTPKGWTCPREVDGHRVEGTWRSHQVPLAVEGDEARLRLLERWLRSYRPEELFDASGAPVPELKALAPRGDLRMSANPVANGGLLRKPLELPDPRAHAIAVDSPGSVTDENTDVLGGYLARVMQANPSTFRVFSPDELASNRLTALYEVTGKAWLSGYLPEDADGGHLSPEGRVMEILSEHTLEGWLEGYLLTGRHGLLATYEAFVHVIDSMVNQHAKWLEKCLEVPWRAPVSSLNILITSVVWRQDHNGFSHQDPGFLDLVANKSPAVTRIYLPPDANCLLCVADRCLKETGTVNVIVADKQPHPQYLSMDRAMTHCDKGVGIWEWASTDHGQEPDVVLACAGDIPTAEALAAAALLRERFPELKLRFVNVVDLFALQPRGEHPHGLTDRDFNSLFTLDKPVIFNFHGYPWLIHRLAYRRANHSNLHVRGYKEKGSINTPLDLAMENQIDRFSLAIDVIDRVESLRVAGAHAKEFFKDQIIENRRYAREHGVDKPEITGWKWPGEKGAEKPGRQVDAD